MEGDRPIGWMRFQEVLGMYRWKWYPNDDGDSEYPADHLRYGRTAFKSHPSKGEWQYDGDKGRDKGKSKGKEKQGKGPDPAQSSSSRGSADRGSGGWWQDRRDYHWGDRRRDDDRGRGQRDDWRDRDWHGYGSHGGGYGNRGGGYGDRGGGWRR